METRADSLQDDLQTLDEGHRAAQCLPLVRQVAARLRRRFGWIDPGELDGYAFIGLTRAAADFEPDRGGSFGPYAVVKGMFHAIDEMRRDGLIRRCGADVPPTSALPGEDVEDPRGDLTFQQMMDHDAAETLLASLPDDDRMLLMMYYGQSMTFREIGRIRGLSEASICMRHRALIQQLRRVARRSAAPGRRCLAGARGTHG